MSDAIAAPRAARREAPTRPPLGCATGCATAILPVFTTLAVIYLFLPIAVMIVFSFNDPGGRQNITWQGFTFRNTSTSGAARTSPARCITSLVVAVVSTLVATILGTMIGLALTRYEFRGRDGINLLIFLPMATPEIIMGASLAARCLCRSGSSATSRPSSSPT